jgi:hypothetical protein
LTSFITTAAYRERTVAGPGYGRWPVPPSALAVQLWTILLCNVTAGVGILEQARR